MVLLYHELSGLSSTFLIFFYSVRRTWRSSDPSAWTCGVNNSYRSSGCPVSSPEPDSGRCTPWSQQRDHSSGLRLHWLLWWWWRFLFLSWCLSPFLSLLLYLLYHLSGFLSSVFLNFFIFILSGKRLKPLPLPEAPSAPLKLIPTRVLLWFHNLSFFLFSFLFVCVLIIHLNSGLVNPFRELF